MFIGKRPIGLIALLCLFSLDELQAQTAKFNFSQASHTVSGWTNVAGDPSMSVVTATSNGITISTVNTANWAPYSGVCSFDGNGSSSGTFFPSGVMVNNWFMYADVAFYNSLTPQFQLSGLDKDSLYQLKMTASSTSSFISNPSRYTVAGRTLYGYIDINAHNNTASGATFNNVRPDTSGHIRVYVNTVPGSEIADICGIQIVRGATTPLPTVTITNPVNNDILAEGGNVSVTASATESGGTIVKVQFFVDTTKIGESTTAPYAATWVDPDEGTYKITATAVDANGNSNSHIINVSVESLTSFWSMTGNISANADSNFVGTVDTNRLAFRTNNLERMSILKDGSVGIGTKNTQGYKLAVDGSAIFTKVRIKAYAAWPDYVFTKEYKLPDIGELEKYILRYRHLPGIDPAEKIRKDGMDIADDQAILLKKIEELTLYVIQDHKRLEKMTKELERLKLRNKKLEARDKRLKMQRPK